MRRKFVLEVRSLSSKYMQHMVIRCERYTQTVTICKDVEVGMLVNISRDS